MVEQEKEKKDEKKPEWDLVHLPNGNVKGKLDIGLQVGDDVLRDYEMRPSTTSDMFDAEMIAPPERQLAYQGALICQQIVRLGDVEGPLDFDMVRKLKPRDFSQLNYALGEVEKPGKPESSPSEDGTRESSSSE